MDNRIDKEMNAGFVMTRQPTEDEKAELNILLSVDDPDMFWSGDDLTVFWENNLKVGDLNGLVGEVFSEAETINHLPF